MLALGSHCAYVLIAYRHARRHAQQRARTAMRRRAFDPAAVHLCGLLCIAPAGAAELVVAGQEGTQDPPHPTQGASTEEDWNPVVTCTVPPGGDINSLLNCLL